MRYNELGRSMIEMVGVLAVIGVLSVTGLYGYNVAMRKHHTNEIMRELVFRANQVSTQLALGADLNEIESLENAFLPPGEYSFTVNACGTNKPCSDTENKFIIVMTAESGTIPVDICHQLYTEIGTNSVVRAMGRAGAYTSADDCGSTDKSSLSFVFNNDLSN